MNSKTQKLCLAGFKILIAFPATFALLVVLSFTNVKITKSHLGNNIQTQQQKPKITPKESAAKAENPKGPYYYSDDIPQHVVEKQPEYKGGYDAMMNFLKNNIRYPETAKKSGIQGTVYIQFIVEKTGKVARVKILRGISKECDEEAIRVVNSMPKWIPGRQSGKAVPVMFQIPVKFQFTTKK